MDDDVREVNDDRSKGLFLKNIRSGRLRAFAFRPRLESFCCIFPSLDSLIQFCDYFANLQLLSLQLESDFSVFGTFRQPL
ncbi:hypothetical protein NC651_018413 [Populus alba x Populus x berolinensis]|nr:hypothetical protein NC651_018413 [Populus alba x Populus x berolinensis]